LEPIYTSRIIKASALIADTKVLLSEWDMGQSVPENLDRARRENIFGKSSRKRVRDILTIFRQRYFDDPDVGGALVTLAQGGAPAQWLDPLLYFYAAQNDRTLRDLVVEVIYPRHLGGYTDLPKDYVIRALQDWVADDRMTSNWGEETIDRVARGFMATLRDFGVLQGTKQKRIAPIYLPTPSFVLIALWLQKHERSGDLVLNSDNWKLFFLPVEGVERFFIEAHQEHMLTYHAAGSVVRIDFPAGNLTEYADALLERAH
jgi:YD repeat-containing protein